MKVTVFSLFAERDARTLFVKNLPYRLTEDEMKDVFENALEIRIVMNKEGNSKGCVAGRNVGFLLFFRLLAYFDKLVPFSYLNEPAALGVLKMLISEAVLFHILPSLPFINLIVSGRRHLLMFSSVL